MRASSCASGGQGQPSRRGVPTGLARPRTRAKPAGATLALTLAVLLAVLLVVLPAASTPAASERLVTPSAEGARHHFAPVAEAAREASLADPIARGLFDEIVDAARAQGLPAPSPDPRLEAAADLLARTLEEGEVPGVELQEHLLSHFGVGEPPPQLFLVQVGASDRAIRKRLARDFPAILRRRPPDRFAVGVHRRFWKTSVVVALQAVDVEMLPVPRRIDAGGSAFLGGRLLRGLAQPRALAVAPSGAFTELPVRGHGDSFQGRFVCQETGRHQIEITATGAAGKTVVANFPIFCGVDPPRSFPRVAARLESRDGREAERLMIEAVNRDRVRAGLPALVWDEELARVARAYSQEMAAGERVGHLSRISGDAAARVRRAGVAVSVIFENVARAGSIADAQRSFMTSPRHRMNVLKPQARRLGVGVVVRPEDSGAPTLYVTQLFAL